MAEPQVDTYRKLLRPNGDSALNKSVPSIQPRADPAERPRAKRLSPVVRRAQILECALKVLGRDGLRAATHASVAAAAGIAEPTAFLYFPTRVDLERAVLDEVARFLIEELVQPMHQRNQPAAEILEICLISFAACIDTHPDHIRIWLEWSTAIRDDLWPLYLKLQARIVTHFKTVIRRGQRECTLPPTLGVDDAARVLVGLGHMIALMKFAGRPQADIAHVVHSLVHGYVARDSDRRASLGKKRAKAKSL